MSRTVPRLGPRALDGCSMKIRGHDDESEASDGREQGHVSSAEHIPSPRIEDLFQIWGHIFTFFYDIANFFFALFECILFLNFNPVMKDEDGDSFVDWGSNQFEELHVRRPKKSGAQIVRPTLLATWARRWRCAAGRQKQKRLERMMVAWSMWMQRQKITTGVFWLYHKGHVARQTRFLVHWRRMASHQRARRGVLKVNSRSLKLSSEAHQRRIVSMIKHSSFVVWARTVTKHTAPNVPRLRAWSYERSKAIPMADQEVCDKNPEASAAGCVADACIRHEKAMQLQMSLLKEELQQAHEKAEMLEREAAVCRGEKDWLNLEFAEREDDFKAFQAETEGIILLLTKQLHQAAAHTEALAARALADPQRASEVEASSRVATCQPEVKDREQGQRAAEVEGAEGDRELASGPVHELQAMADACTCTLSVAERLGAEDAGKQAVTTQHLRAVRRELAIALRDISALQVEVKAMADARELGGRKMTEERLARESTEARAAANSRAMQTMVEVLRKEKGRAEEEARLMGTMAEEEVARLQESLALARGRASDKMVAVEAEVKEMGEERRSMSEEMGMLRRELEEAGARAVAATQEVERAATMMSKMEEEVEGHRRARREAEDGLERAKRETAEREEELRAQGSLMERAVEEARAGVRKKMEDEVAVMQGRHAVATRDLEAMVEVLRKEKGRAEEEARLMGTMAEEEVARLQESLALARGRASDKMVAVEAEVKEMGEERRSMSEEMGMLRRELEEAGARAVAATQEVERAATMMSKMEEEVEGHRRARREAEDGLERAKRETAEREEELRAQGSLMERAVEEARAGVRKKMEDEVAVMQGRHAVATRDLEAMVEVLRKEKGRAEEEARLMGTMAEEEVARLQESLALARGRASDKMVAVEAEVKEMGEERRSMSEEMGMLRRELEEAGARAVAATQEVERAATMMSKMEEEVEGHRRARREAEDGLERAKRETAEREEELRAQGSLMERAVEEARAGVRKKMEDEVATLRFICRSELTCVLEVVGHLEVQVREVDDARRLLKEEEVVGRQNLREAVQEGEEWRKRSEEATERIEVLEAQLREDRRSADVRLLEKDKVIEEKEEALSAHRRLNLSRRYESESLASRCAMLQEEVAQAAERLRRSESLLEERRVEVGELEVRAAALQEETAVQRGENLALALKLQQAQVMVEKREAELQELAEERKCQRPDASGVGVDGRDDLIKAAERALAALDRVHADQLETREALGHYISENSRLRERLQRRETPTPSTDKAAPPLAGRSGSIEGTVSDCEGGNERQGEGGVQCLTAAHPLSGRSPGVGVLRSSRRVQGGVAAGRTVSGARRALRVAAGDPPCGRPGDSPGSSGPSSPPSPASSLSSSFRPARMAARSSPRWK